MSFTPFWAGCWVLTFPFPRKSFFSFRTFRVRNYHSSRAFLASSKHVFLFLFVLECRTLLTSLFVGFVLVLLRLCVRLPRSTLLRFYPLCPLFPRLSIDIFVPISISELSWPPHGSRICTLGKLPLPSLFSLQNQPEAFLVPFDVLPFFLIFPFLSIEGQPFCTLFRTL